VTTAPGVPSVSGNSSSSSSIDLTFSLPYSSDSVYIRYRQGQPAPSSMTDGSSIGSQTVTPYVHIGLNSNTEYCYSVWAYNTLASLYSDTPATVCVTTLAPAPAIPSLSVTAVSPTSINIDYDLPVNAVRTEIERIAPAQSWSQTSGTSVTDSGLTADTQSCYRARSCNSQDSCSDYTSNQCINTWVVLAVPSLSVSAISSSSINITYNLPANAVRTEIERIAPVQSWSQTSGTSVTDSGLTADTQYCYRARSCNSQDSCSDYTTNQCAVTDTPNLSLLKAIDGFKGEANGDKVAVTEYSNIPVEYIEYGSVHYSSSANLGSSLADQRMLAVRYRGDVIIDAGTVITSTARKKGMVLYVDGALVVNGNISMTDRGAASVPGDRIFIFSNNGTNYEIPAIGGLANNSGVNGQTGGGGDGGVGSGAGGSGAAGTSYSGGAGGAGYASNSGTNIPESSGGINGGAGGICYSHFCGGGAGNPGGAGINGGGNADTGTGGLLIIYANSIVIGSTGSINSNGSPAGGGWYAGGGSGAGSINIIYQSSYINNGSVTATGGISGNNSYTESAGINGGDGSIRNILESKQAPAISTNNAYNINEQTANVDVVISEDYGRGNSTILLEWGNEMGNYVYSSTLTDKGEGSYLMTMDRLDYLPLSKTYYRVTVTNSSGATSFSVGNFYVQKSLLTGIRSLDGTGNGNKSIVTAYSTIPVEYVQIDTDTTYASSPVIGNAVADSYMLALRYKGNLTINSGVTLSPQVTKRGMFLFVDGTLTINGIISMTDRGARNTTGDRILILSKGGTPYEVPAVGGLSSSDGTNGQTGGGGNGGVGSGEGGSGAAGTSYSGGAGGAGSGGSGGVNGGAGGNCGYRFCGGGAGNPGGSGNNGGGGGDSGTGGLLIIYANSISIGSTGSIQSNGSPAGGGYFAGGGSGAGSINIFYTGSYLNSGSIAATGGSSGNNSFTTYSGLRGGHGTVRNINVGP
ncbi:MAG: hypothetical protein PHW52_05125, partial [Candidatus Pacebacteria bacterium]|nr:hypothetical protein [Candidatus Paceibacterota bacterium]